MRLPPIHILVIDDEESIRWVIQQTLEPAGHHLYFAASAEEAAEMVERNPIDVAVVDIHLPGADGLTFLREQQERHPELLIAVITADSTMGNAVEAMKMGAFDYLTKPFDIDELETLIGRAAESVRAQRSHPAQPRAEAVAAAPDEIIIGKSRSIREVYKSIGRVADSDLTVLILGESGTGKELIARSLHQHSGRASEPFAGVNCAAIPRDLLEAELFGFEKGAFTGAVERKAGRLEAVGFGTIFLDEIGDMSLELQAKLLRVLQEREFQRVGGLEPIRLRARVVAATNQGLLDAVQAGRFRSDLYYRLSPFIITVDPLRERREDISLLVQHFLAQSSDRLGLAPRTVTPEAMERLVSYDWPGNVRELENVVKSMTILTASSVIGEADLPRNIAGEGAPVNPGKRFEESVLRYWSPIIDQYCEAEKTGLLQELLGHLERPLIRKVLEKSRWNQVRAAKVLGINRNTLRARLQSLGIRRKPSAQA